MKRSLSPTAAIGVSVALLFLLTIATTAASASSFAVELNETQIMYLYSTSAQSLSAIYGLTLTGFVFFRNELSREEFDDDTLTDAVEHLKSRYFTLLFFITLLVGLTLLLSHFEIAY